MFASVDLLQQTWRGMDTGGQCRVEGVFGLPGLIHQSNTLR